MVTLGYSVPDSFESGAAGPNAALRVRIPLRDRSNELKTAQARAAWRRAEDAARPAFLADLQSLCELAGEVHALDTRRAFHPDRLAYRQEQVDQGLDEADTPWTETEAAQRAEHEWQRATAKLMAQRRTLARRYGGEEWQRLGFSWSPWQGGAEGDRLGRQPPLQCATGPGDAVASGRNKNL